MMFSSVFFAFILTLISNNTDGAISTTIEVLRWLVIILCFLIAPVHFKRFIRWAKSNK